MGLTMKRTSTLLAVAALSVWLSSCNPAPEPSDVGRYVLVPANVASADPNHPGAAPVAAAWVLDSRSGAVRYCTVSSGGVLGC
jgi:hypothetical protein